MRILLTADLHLRGDAPACRKDPDAWMEEQAQSVRQLYPIASRCDEVWIVGDLFHIVPLMLESIRAAKAAK